MEILDVPLTRNANKAIPSTISQAECDDAALEHLQALASEISYKGWCFEVDRKDDFYILEVTTGTTADLDDTRFQISIRRWRVLADEVSPQSVDWLVDAAREMIVDIAKHEVDEVFKFRGVRVYYPHPSLEARMAMAAACDPTYFQKNR